MQIRTATAADVPKIAAIARSASTAAQWSSERYAQMFASADEGVQREVLVLEGDGGVIEGFLVGIPLGVEWEIENVVVSEARRGHGLGPRLVEDFCEQAKARGGERICLEVRDSTV